MSDEHDLAAELPVGDSEENNEPQVEPEVVNEDPVPVEDEPAVEEPVAVEEPEDEPAAEPEMEPEVEEEKDEIPQPMDVKPDTKAKVKPQAQSAKPPARNNKTTVSNFLEKVTTKLLSNGINICFPFFVFLIEK